MKQKNRKNLVEENIKKLRAREIVLKGTKLTEDLSDLRRILRAAFSEDGTACTGGRDYYLADASDKKYWSWSKTNEGLPEVPLDDFFEK